MVRKTEAHADSVHQSIMKAKTQELVQAQEALSQQSQRFDHHTQEMQQRFESTEQQIHRLTQALDV